MSDSCVLPLIASSVCQARTSFALTISKILNVRLRRTTMQFRIVCPFHDFEISTLYPVLLYRYCAPQFLSFSLILVVSDRFLLPQLIHHA